MLTKSLTTSLKEVEEAVELTKYDGNE